jgi:hypothetical protein
MRNPIPCDDKSSREDNKHVEREPIVDIGKKGKCIQLKGITSTLVPVENNLFGGTPVGIVTTRNGTGRIGGKYMREVF